MSIISTIEADAEKVLSFLTKSESKVSTIGPQIVAGLGTLLGAVASAITSGSAAASAGGVNIALDVQTFENVKAVWPQIEAFAAELGIKL